MKNDPIVEEIRHRREVHAAKYGNDLRKICDALRQEEKHANFKVINRGPKLLNIGVTGSRENHINKS
jgi:hypothetical protein